MEFDPNKHPNFNEHKDSPLKFIYLFVISGLAATFLGGILEKIIFYCLKDGELPDGKWINLFYLFFQLVLNSIVFFLMFRFISFRNKFGTLTFDDWLSGTFQGIIFTATFFSSQTNLPIYAANIFK